MKDVEIKRIVPVSRITLIGVIFLGIFQVTMLVGGYHLEATVVKKSAPWFYDSFRKFVGEHPSTRPAELEKTSSSGRKSAVDAVTGINPEEISVDLKEALPAKIRPEDTGVPLIPVSKPEQSDPLDSDEPVG